MGRRIKELVASRKSEARKRQNQISLSMLSRQLKSIAQSRADPAICEISFQIERSAERINGR